MSAPAGAELLDYISWPSVECLNAQPDHGAANALKQVLPAATLCSIVSHCTALDQSQGGAALVDSRLAHCKAWTLRLMPTLQPLTYVCWQGYREDDGLWLESDTDEQLLLHIQFNQGAPAARARHALTAEGLGQQPAHVVCKPCGLRWRPQLPAEQAGGFTPPASPVRACAAVKLSGLVVKAEAGDSAPRRVKLFTNQPSLGFSEAASERPTQEFALSEEDLAGRVLPLRRAAPAVHPHTPCGLPARACLRRTRRGACCRSGAPPQRSTPTQPGACPPGPKAHQPGCVGVAGASVA